jgi:hypothetical protein
MIHVIEWFELSLQIGGELRRTPPVGRALRSGIKKAPADFCDG